MSFGYSPVRLARKSLVAAAMALIPVFMGGWSWIEGPQSTFDVQGPVAKAQLDVFYVTLWVTGVIFVLVAAILAYATLKFRAKSEADEHAQPPEQSHGNPLIELGLIAASVGALVIIAVPTLRAIWYTYDVPEEHRENAYEVTAVGYQWWFRFEYPMEQIDGAGPLVAANELVIPAGRPVRVNLRTWDVIHSFWVPKLAGKVDMMPNRGNHLWLKAAEPGYFWGQCAEFCGESHAVMRFRVIALPEKEFAEWTARQKAGARTPDAAAKAQFASYQPAPRVRNAPGYSEAFDSDPMGAWVRQQVADEASEDAALIARGRELFAQKTCIQCHVVRGHFPGGAHFAPDLTHLGGRSTIAGGLLENTPANLHRWLTDPNGVKPGNKMYYGVGGMNGYKSRDAKTGEISHNFSVNDDEARALVAYLLSLK
jgi:cytochrome c oxidase subunit II